MTFKTKGQEIAERVGGVALYAVVWFCLIAGVLAVGKWLDLGQQRCVCECKADAP